MEKTEKVKELEELLANQRQDMTAMTQQLNDVVSQRFGLIGLFFKSFNSLLSHFKIKFILTSYSDW